MSSIDPRMLVEGLIILILSIAVHEFGHAFVADKLGDRLPRSDGRVTLNPLAHIDPIGTLLLPAFGMIAGYGSIGWGRPVMVRPNSFTRRFSMRTGHAMVAAAGPGMNILFALVISLITFGLVRTGVVEATSGGIFEALSRAIFLNCILAFFNLIPSPPLDGGTVIEWILPTRLLPQWQNISRYGFFIVMAFMVIPQLRWLYVAPAQHLYWAWAGGVLGLPVMR